MSMYQKLYYEEITPKLMKQFGYKSVMEVPKIVKITLNMGVGETVGDKKIINAAVQDMAMIAGQKPVITLARNSVAGFKIRADFPIGCKVTLRRVRMYDFLQRVKSFDGRGNYSLGISEQIIFPEIDYDKIDAIRGLDITITTTANTDREAWALLEAFHFPLREHFDSKSA